MCCFSQSVEMVSSTSIFARSVNGQMANNRQILVYSMTYAARADLAMVLPLPVPANPPEDAVRFINLQRYPGFFLEMQDGFPYITSLGLKSAMPAHSLAKLRVHEVGSYEASFVPRLDDFERLDERFRIPREVWNQMPAYHDYGFAVFKLRGSHGPRAAGGLRGWLRNLFHRRSAASPPEPHRVHPMAFEFPRRDPNLLYYPTVHVHDRKVHRHALFDHMLYCQPDPATEEYLEGWEKSDGPASAFMDVDRAEGIVRASDYCWRLSLEGRFENKDTLVGRLASLALRLSQ